MTTGLLLKSTMKSTGSLQLSLDTVESPPLGADDILVEVQAAPINPSDLGLLLGPADVARGETRMVDGRPLFEAPVPSAAMKHQTARLDKSMSVGNEGAGLVVDAGDAENAQALIGRTVSLFGGSMYSQYRVAKAKTALVLPEGVTARHGASSFVNPMTVLSFLETMRLEGHSALIHTAAASNLGQMLVKVCADEGVPLVNIVRSQEHVEILRGLGAVHVVNSGEAGFQDALVDAISQTGATLAFDAIGGGDMVDWLLSAMESAASDNDPYNRYGSTVHKQVYTYGSLDFGPTTLTRSYGMAWGVGGWLVMNLLQRVGPEKAAELRARVGREITTTFASTYSDEISLSQVLEHVNIVDFQRKATGRKFLINPSLG